MAEVKRSYPMLPVAHWWSLRKKFKQSIPGVVTDNYLATVLSMSVDSARANVLPFLKTLGIIDDDGKTGERAKLWRDDGHYPEVCKSIIAEVYPQELIDAVPDPRQNREAAKRWFANHTGSGDSACGRMAALYTILVDADPAGQPDGQKSKPETKAAGIKQASKASKPQTRPRAAPIEKDPPPPPASAPRRHDGPEVSINLQIHISADASADQIEQIFAAMSKHIYKQS